MNQASTSAGPRGTKRKRPEIPKEDQLAGKLHHELKAVHQAAKKARTFETQRVVKKLKGLRKKDPASDSIGAFEAEFDELKTTEADVFAQTALRTRLLGNRHLSENAALRAAITRELPLVLDNSTASKVPARLLSSRALAAAVVQAVEAIRAALMPKAEVDASKVADAEPVELAEEDEEMDEPAGEEKDENSEAEDDAAGWESGSVDDGEGEEDGDGWESGSIHSVDEPPAKKPALSKAKIAPVTKPATSSKASAKAATTDSQFLPSLQVGFVRGGSSESDFEEDENKVVGGRKNRRGQRARQAIWEKKYGRGANHKKKEAEEATRLAKAKAAKVKGPRGKARWTESAQVADGGWVGRKAPHAAQPQEPSRKSEPNLHPSWVAKKALKEKLGAGGIVPSQGKKIVFT
ncbi:Bud-site selection protein [Roridomyces roridus]|uniref:Bud-site selection protein n=1 Tax=Roridomyces roridus TaxID=1738132 RepID=A0AAD7FYC9_9AGAR|nr:Bud-site selection protein [Roridomyces roridus]